MKFSATDFKKLIYARGWSWDGYFTCKIDGGLPAICDTVLFNGEEYTICRTHDFKFDTMTSVHGDIFFTANHCEQFVKFRTNIEGLVNNWCKDFQNYPYYYGRFMNIKSERIYK